MRDPALLVVVAAWLALLGLGTLVVRREVGLLADRLASTGRTPMDGLAVGSFAPRLPGLARDDVVLFLFGDCASCRDVVDAVRDSPVAGRMLCVVNDGTVPGSADGIVARLPAAMRRVVGAGAVAALARFQVHSAPFGMAIVDGLVAAKGTLRDSRELDRLIHHVERLDRRGPRPGRAAAPRREAA